MAKNVLITGGTGFVGSWMRKTQPAHLNAWFMSRADYEMVYIERTTGIDYVVHLANVSPYPAIECARRNDARLLYCSSGAVYHPENDNEYRRNKMDWESECLYSGVDVIIARPFTFLGFSPAQTTLFDAARAGRPLEVWGDCIRSFMTGADLGRMMWAILFEGERGQAYDVGSDRPVTILRLAQRIKALCRTDSEIVFVDKPVPMPVYLPENPEKTKRLYNQYVEIQPRKEGTK